MKGFHGQRWGRLLVLALAGCAATLFWSTAAWGQIRVRGLYHPSMAIPEYDRETKVLREHVLVVLPPTYLGMTRPVPPVHGFYVWKLSFNGNNPLSFVLRTDSAVAAKDERDVLRLTKLYLCRDADQPVRECSTPVKFRARRAREHIEVDILDTEVSAKLRAGRPSILNRQLLEPGGRFRVDEVGVLVP